MKNLAESHGYKAGWQAESRLVRDAIVPIQQPDIAKARNISQDIISDIQLILVGKR
jgi:hypothetical protein